MTYCSKACIHLFITWYVLLCFIKFLLFEPGHLVLAYIYGVIVVIQKLQDLKVYVESLKEYFQCASSSLFSL